MDTPTSSTPSLPGRAMEALTHLAEMAGLRQPEAHGPLRLPGLRPARPVERQVLATNPGATSEVNSHSVDLAEHHQIVVARLPGDPTDKELTLYAALARDAARAWAQSNDIGIEPTVFADTHIGDGGCHTSPVLRTTVIGARWKVVVGTRRGGLLSGRWLWSARWQHWADTFADMLAGYTTGTPALRLVPKCMPEDDTGD